MMRELNKFGYTKNYFPFNSLEIKELKLISKSASSLTTDERKDIFIQFPRVKELFENAILKSELKLVLTRYCFFIEKNSSRNWPLLFHRDINLPEYMNISTKDKDHFLKNAVMFRLTLDTSDKETGAIKVIPMSHIEKTSKEEVFVDTQEGEVILFKPLLLHGSNKMKRPHQRRVFQALCIAK